MRLAPDGLDPLRRVVDYLRPNFIGLRTVDGLYRFHGMAAFGMPIAVGHHLFADDVDREKAEQAWRVLAERGVRLGEVLPRRTARRGRQCVRRAASLRALTSAPTGGRSSARCGRE